MKKKAGKIFLSILITLFAIQILTAPCQASWVWQNPDVLNPKGQVSMPIEGQEMAGKLLGIIQIIGSFIAVIILMIIGIRYMLGSVQDKAEYKKSMIPYLIGAVLIFSGTLLPKVIYDVVMKMGT